VKLEFSLILVDQTTRFVRSVLRNWGFQMEIFLFFFYQKHLFFLFYFEREKKDEKVRKEEKEKKEKKAYTSQICFFYGCKKLLFWLLSIVYTFLIAGKGQQCLTIFKVKFYN